MKRIENPSLSWDSQEQPFSQGFDDIYFHRKNGLEESRLVFLAGNNLPDSWLNTRQFTIAETGFGSGLNFLATWEMFDRTASAEQFLDFISFEKYPMHRDDLARALRPWAESIGAHRVERLIETYPLRIPGFHRIWVTDRITLTLVFDDVLRGLRQLDYPIDAWFLDGFSPSKNPEIWSDAIFAEMARLSHADTTLASFTAVSHVRHTLAQHGFSITREKGFAYKAHRITGHFTHDRPKPNKPTVDHVTIIGAGLAGSATAYALRRRGIRTTILEKENAPAQGASGNRIGLINPKIEAQDNPRNDAGLSAYAFALHLLRDIARKHPEIDYQTRGALHLEINDAKAQRLQRITTHHAWLEPHMRVIPADETDSICGFSCAYNGVLYADAASVHTAALVSALLNGLDVRYNTAHHEKTQQPVVYANGLALRDHFDQFPLQAVRGQVSYARIPSLSVKCPVMFGAYIAPVSDDVLCLGATFQQNDDDPLPRSKDTHQNIDAVCAALSLDPTEIHIEKYWSHIRTASRDRFPIGGKMDDNTYICGALGSHGIQFSLLIGEIIACLLSGAPLPVGKDAAAALSPQRFIKPL